jgi:hypothetical protein
MGREIWVGFVEVRQLPGIDHAITLSGKGAFTWITCWATDESGYASEVSKVMADYGLFVFEVEQVMPFALAEEKGIVDDELMEQFEDTLKNENFCIYRTFHSYPADN